MKKLTSLLKAAMSQDMDLFNAKTKDSGVLVHIFLPIFLSIMVMFSMGFYSYMFAEKLAPLGLTFIVLTMFVLFTSVLTLMEGIYKSQGILFDSKDNDLLFSLPISKSRILFIRLFKMLSFETFYNALFLFPVMVVYAILESPGVSFYIISFIMLLLIPIIPTILSCIIGYVIKGISSKSKVKNLLQVVLSAIFLVFFFYFSYNIEGFIENIAENATSINDMISKIYYPAGLYINLIQDFKLLDLILLFIVCIVPIVIFIFIASKFYFKIISNSSEKSKRKHVGAKFNDKSFKSRKPIKALILKEIKRFLSSPVFITNSGFGLVIMIVATIGLVSNSDYIINSIMSSTGGEMSIGEISELLPKIFLCLVVFTSCMTSITSSLVSLEGKSFNVTKSLPIPTKRILLSKILMSIIIVIPIILVCDLIFFIKLGASLLDIFYILLSTILFPIFIALVGLITNLYYPNMKASSDTEVVKQSFSATVATFVGMIVGMSTIGLIVMGSEVNLNIAIGIELAGVFLIDIILWMIIMTKGVKKWDGIYV